MIVGTAGHIDHGKTALVRALTGVDGDRLPEEKARGISIELGYAFLDDADRIGFIDVPGHERLVHTMISGATGIDFGLLLVAADDGVMPQTREHLAVLSLLGLRRSALVITKADRVDAARIASVHADLRALVADTAFADAPILAVSAHTGMGIDTLRTLLRDAAREGTTQRTRQAVGNPDPDAAAGGAFRLAIDRAFTLAGVGTIVTGTVHAGRVRVGDELALVPSWRGVVARVRSLHAQNRVVDEAHAGERCALALVGIAKDEIQRGQWMVDPAAALQTDRFDATLTLWRDESRPLRSGTPVHVHLGACEAIGSVAVLQADGRDAQALQPGQRGFVQVVLQRPIAAWHGDRVIVRDASASRTLAGGTVLDPFAPSRYRRTPQRMAELEALTRPTAADRWRGLVAAGGQGVSLTRRLRAEGTPGSTHADDMSRASANPSDPLSGTLVATAPDGERWALGAVHARRSADAAVAALQAFHDRDPEMPGPDGARLRRLASPRLPEPLWKALLASLAADGRVVVRGNFVHLPSHGARLSELDERLSRKFAPLLAKAGFEGAWARDLARATGDSEPIVRGTLARLAQRGDLHQVVRDLYLPVATIVRLAATVRSIATAPITAGRFRDATGLGRKRAIQILEYFDRIALLHRVGDEHRLRPDTELFREPSS